MKNNEIKKLMICMPMKGKTDDQINAEWNEWKSMFEKYNKTHPDDPQYEVLPIKFNPPEEEYKRRPLYYLSQAILQMAKDVDVIFFAPDFEKYKVCWSIYNVCTTYSMAYLMGRDILEGFTDFELPDRYKISTVSNTPNNDFD